jgi:hypothetical protein
LLDRLAASVGRPFLKALRATELREKSPPIVALMLVDAHGISFSAM